MRVAHICKRFLVIFGITLLGFSITACSHTTSVPKITTSSVEQTSDSFKKIKTVRFEISGFLSKETTTSAYMYLDTVTNTTFIYFLTNYHSCLIPLVDTDGTPKQYSKDNTNNLVLVEDSNFLVFEDADTGVQYIVTKNFNNYMIRR